MKKIQLFLFLALIISSSYAQLENANWFFGDHAGLNFQTIPVSISMEGQTTEGRVSATVSDPTTGELLFYTDGHNIWNNNHVFMSGSINNFPNSNIGSVLISPFPSHINKYIVISTIRTSGSSYNYYYSIVDMNLNSGLGQVTVMNQLIGIPSSEYGKSMVIAKHSNGYSFWLITMRERVFYAYLIDDIGISITGISSDFRNQLEFRGWDMYNYIFSISQDNRKIAFATSESTVGTRRNVNFFVPFLYVFNFDNSTAIFSRFYDDEAMQDNVLTDIGDPKSVEFSDNFLYVLGVESDYHGGVYYEKIIQIDINNISGGYTYYQDISSGVFAYHVYDSVRLRRAMDGKIYIPYAYGDVYPLSNKLAVINNPDGQGSSCNLVLDQVDLLTGKAQLLPYLVLNQNICFPDLVINQNVVSGTDYREASNSIIAYNTIENNANSIYKAGNNIILKNGFQAVYGSTFHAYIENCNEEHRGMNNYNEIPNLLKNKKEEQINFEIFPNPSTGDVTIKTNIPNDSSHIIIYDSYGIEVFKQNISQQETHFNFNFLRNGIYIIKYFKNQKNIIRRLIIKG